MKDKKQLNEQEKQARWRKTLGYVNELGKILIDVTKLAIGSLVFGSVIRSEISQEIIFTAGVIFSVIIGIGGLLMARAGKEEYYGKFI